MARYTDLPDNKNKPFGGAYSVYDRHYLYYAGLFSSKYAVNTSYHDFESYKLDYFDHLNIFSLTPHNLMVLISYTHSCFTQGTTESFAHFYTQI